MDMNDKHLLTEIHTTVKRLDLFMTGGDEPEKGVILRLHTLELSHSTIRKIFWLAVGGLVTPGTIGTLIYFLLEKR